MQKVLARMNSSSTPLVPHRQRGFVWSSAAKTHKQKGRQVVLVTEPC